MTTSIKIKPYAMPLTELAAIIHFLTGVRDERMDGYPAPVAPSELLTPEEKAALLTPPANQCGQPVQLEEQQVAVESDDEITEAFDKGYNQGFTGGKDLNLLDFQIYPRQWSAYEDGFEMGQADMKRGAKHILIRASAGGDQAPYALNAGGSDDFAELREEVNMNAEVAFAPKPPALPVASAEPGTTVPTSSQDGSVTVDSAGLPWDERIHASSKAIIADGTWRRKRGVDDALVVEVEGELRALMAITSEQSVSHAPEVPAAPKPPVPPVPGLASTAAPAPAAPPVPPPPAPVVTALAGPSSPAPAVSSAEPQAAPAVTFASLFKRATALKLAHDGKTFPGEAEILESLGVPTWVALAKQPELFEAAWEMLPK